MSKKIAIIGAGMMGSALAYPAFENGNEVRLVGTPLDREIIDECIKNNKHLKFDIPFPQGIKYYQFEDWKTAVEGVDFVIGGVSSFGVDWFLTEVLAHLDPSIPVLSVTKGLINLEDGTLISYPDYWKRELAKMGIEREVCAIGGPCTSYELVFHDQTEVAFCGENSAVLKMMKEAMATDYYHISLTNDVIGLESAVALKNGYALAIAMTIGLVNRDLGADAGLHYNSQAGAFYQAVKEMRYLLEMQGASRDCESLPWKLGIFALIKHCCSMAKHWEHAEVCLTEFCLTDHCSIYATCNNKTLESNTSKNIKSLLISLALTEENTDLTCTTAIYSHI